MCAGVAGCPVALVSTRGAERQTAKPGRRLLGVARREVTEHATARLMVERFERGHEHSECHDLGVGARGVDVHP